MPFEILYINRIRPLDNRAGLLQSLHTVAAMQEAGFQAALYLPPWPATIGLDERIAQFGINTKLDVRLTTFLHHRWKRWGTFKPFVWRYYRSLKRANALYTRWPDISLELARAGLPNHVEIHNTHELEKKQLLNPLVQAHQRGQVAWLLPTLQHAADFLISAGAKPDRICVVPNGADLEAFGRVAPFDPGRLDNPEIVYAGTLEAARGMQVLQTIATSGAARVTLVGAHKESVREVPGLTVKPRIPHRDVPKLYETADLVVLPYQKQLVHVNSVCPIKLFEAMAAGRPIIASDIPTIREIVTHMQDAILVDPDDAPGWVDAVQLLKHDRALASRIAAAAKRHSVNFSWHSRVRRIAQALGWPLETDSARDAFATSSRVV